MAPSARNVVDFLVFISFGLIAMISSTSPVTVVSVSSAASSPFRSSLLRGQRRGRHHQQQDTNNVVLLTEQGTATDENEDGGDRRLRSRRLILTVPVKKGEDEETNLPLAGPTTRFPSPSPTTAITSAPKEKISKGLDGDDSDDDDDDEATVTVSPSVTLTESIGDLDVSSPTLKPTTKAPIAPPTLPSATNEPTSVVGALSPDYDSVVGKIEGILGGDDFSSIGKGGGDSSKSNGTNNSLDADDNSMVLTTVLVIVVAVIMIFFLGLSAAMVYFLTRLQRLQEEVNTTPSLKASKTDTDEAYTDAFTTTSETTTKTPNSMNTNKHDHFVDEKSGNKEVNDPPAASNPNTSTDGSFSLASSTISLETVVEEDERKDDNGTAQVLPTPMENCDTDYTETRNHQDESEQLNDTEEVESNEYGATLSGTFETLDCIMEEGEENKKSPFRMDGPTSEADEESLPPETITDLEGVVAPYGNDGDSTTAQETGGNDLVPSSGIVNDSDLDAGTVLRIFDGRDQIDHKVMSPIDFDTVNASFEETEHLHMHELPSTPKRSNRNLEMEFNGVEDVLNDEDKKTESLNAPSPQAVFSETSPDKSGEVFFSSNWDIVRACGNNSNSKEVESSPLRPIILSASTTAQSDSEAL